jgi:hypothetical protein
MAEFLIQDEIDALLDIAEGINIDGEKIETKIVDLVLYNLIKTTESKLDVKLLEKKIVNKNKLANCKLFENKNIYNGMDKSGFYCVKYMLNIYFNESFVLKIEDLVDNDNKKILEDFELFRKYIYRFSNRFSVELNKELLKNQIDKEFYLTETFFKEKDYENIEFNEENVYFLYEVKFLIQDVVYCIYIEINEYMKELMNKIIVKSKEDVDVMDNKIQSLNVSFDFSFKEEKNEILDVLNYLLNNYNVDSVLLKK